MGISLFPSPVFDRHRHIVYNTPTAAVSGKKRSSEKRSLSTFEFRTTVGDDGGRGDFCCFIGGEKKKEKNSSNTFMEKKNRRFTGIGEISWKRVFIVFFFFCCPRFARVFSRTRRPRIDFYTRSASGGEWRVRVQYITDGRTFVYDIYIYIILRVRVGKSQGRGGGNYCAEEIQ